MPGGKCVTSTSIVAAVVYTISVTSFKPRFSGRGFIHFRASLVSQVYVGLARRVNAAVFVYVCAMCAVVEVG